MQADTKVLSDADLQQVMAQLADAENEIPRRAIKLARKHRDAIIPLLMECLQDAARNKRDGGLIDSNGPYISLLLLAEFEARQALPAVVELFSLPEEDLEALIGGGLTEDVNRVLAILADRQTDVLDSLARNPALSEYVRNGAQAALVMLVRDEKLSREAAVELLSDQLRQQIDERSPQATWTVCALSDLAAAESIDDIRRAFEAELVETDLTGDFESLADSLRGGEAEMQRAFRRHYPSGYEDTIDELSWMERDNSPRQTVQTLPEPHWSANTVVRDKPKVRRNDPCPCGSGLKFKKCCGAK